MMTVIALRQAAASTLTVTLRLKVFRIGNALGLTARLSLKG